MTHVEQLLEEWRNELELSKQMPLLTAHLNLSERFVELQQCIQELESAIQRDKEQGK